MGICAPCRGLKGTPQTPNHWAPTQYPFFSLVVKGCQKDQNPFWGSKSNVGTKSGTLKLASVSRPLRLPQTTGDRQKDGDPICLRWESLCPSRWVLTHTKNDARVIAGGAEPCGLRYPRSAPFRLLRPGAGATRDRVHGPSQVGLTLDLSSFGK